MDDQAYDRLSLKEFINLFTGEPVDKAENKKSFKG